MVTSLDLVHWQIRIARGERLDHRSRRARSRRTATRSSAASTPRIRTKGSCRRPAWCAAIRPASGPGIRDDGGVLPGYTVPVFYDSMIAKLVAWAGTRDEAIARMTRALEEYESPRHQDDDPVLPVADARARLHRRPLRHDLSRPAARVAARRVVQRASPTHEEQHDRDRRGARRVVPRQRRPASGGGRAAAAAPGRSPRGRKRCASGDVRDRASNGTQPHRVDRARRRRRTATASRRRRAPRWSTRSAAASPACRCSFPDAAPRRR